MIRFGLLGPVVAGSGGVLVPVSASMPRSVLTALLLNANRVVAVGRLIDIVWDEHPPASAIASLHNHVRRLRTQLGEPDAGRVRAVAPGYLIEVADGDLDVDVHARLSEQARQAAADGDWAAAAARLTEALALWRGEPLADVTSAQLRDTEVPRLAQLRLDAEEARIDAFLQLGRYQEAITELSVLTAAHPLRERFHGQLMLARSRAGRPAEALAAYQRARKVLAEELGVEPCAALQQLYQQILAADPAVAAGPAVPPDGLGETSRRRAVVMQLPPDPADFTGRAAQIKQMCAALDAHPDEARPGSVVISAVAGMGGIGKTALSVHVAHRLRCRFPDGQLFASLHGNSSPLRPAAVLARFLRDLGIPDAVIPADEAERAARYRSLLASRSMLIVLDDARDAAQVRPLLPGAASCAVIVTSRNALPDLAGAMLIDLDVLDQFEASALFGAVVGQQRAAAEPDATVRVLACCAGLPLAVRIAASRLASRPGWSIAHLAAKLTDERARMAELTAGDLGVRASFAVSYDALPRVVPDGPGRPGGPDPARLFRLLGLPGAVVLGLPAIAALADEPAGDVAAALESLTDAHMLESPAAERFRLHDLLRRYAAELAEAAVSPGDRSAALRRVLCWYRDQAIIAARVLAPGRGLPVSAADRPGIAAIASSAQALDWFETERASLVAAVRQAAELGWHDVAAQIAVAMWGFFQCTHHDQDWLATSQAGVSSARHMADDAVLSWLLNRLGQVHTLRREFADSRRCLTEALDIRRRAGDRSGMAKVLNSLAIDLHYQDQFEAALGCLESALATHVDLGERPDAAVIMSNIGDTLRRLDRHDEALDQLRHALAIWHETGDRYGAGVAENGLGDVCLDLGRFQDAVDHYQRALAAHEGIMREHTDQANILCNLGRALRSLGRVREARDAWRAAVPILERNNDPRAADLRARIDEAAAPH